MLSIRVILIGDSSVGKTSLIQQYIKKKFTHLNLQTISGDKNLKEINLRNKKVKLEIWDTPGIKKYNSVNKIYINKAKIAAFVYDITNQVSFYNIKKWYEDIKNKNNTIKIIGVIANKSDLYEESVINKEEGENYAKSINALFFETSALDYESVSIVFEGLAKNYVENNEIEYNEIENNNNNNIPLIEGRNDRKKCCSC